MTQIVIQVWGEPPCNVSHRRNEVKEGRRRTCRTGAVEFMVRFKGYMRLLQSSYTRLREIRVSRIIRYGLLSQLIESWMLVTYSTERRTVGKHRLQYRVLIIYHMQLEILVVYGKLLSLLLTLFMFVRIITYVEN